MTLTERNEGKAERESGCALTLSRAVNVIVFGGWGGSGGKTRGVCIGATTNNALFSILAELTKYGG